MAKWCGTIGFIEHVQTTPGVWDDKVTERKYYGDIIRNTRGWSTPTEGTNDNLTLSNQVSVVSDSFAIEKFAFMKYAEIMGARWKITNIDIQYPRLILTIGGVYNG
jgi:hypothetical protein